MILSSQKLKDFCFGSKSWADSVLRIALKDVWGRGSRVLGSRLQLIFYCRSQLVDFKFPRHVKVLNFQIHRAQRNGVLKWENISKQGSSWSRSTTEFPTKDVFSVSNLSLQHEFTSADPPRIVGEGGGYH